MNYIILSEKTWNASLIERMQNVFPLDTWIWIKSREEFIIENLEELHPDKIFIPHWSYIIPESIYNKFDCIVFHMTDLPYGRGGSPLQNLIINGKNATKISALKVCKGLDAGDIYLKKDMSLYGTAEEIYMRANRIIEEMIAEIVEKQLQPRPQYGEPVLFKRRTSKDSNIVNLTSIEEVFDYIRMLDAEGYPHAYVEVGNIHIEFSRASLKADGTIKADVSIKLI